MLFHGIDDVICKKSCDSFFRYYHWILGKKNLSHFKWCQNHCFCYPMWGNNWDLVIKGFVLFEMLRTIPLQKVSTHFCGFPVRWEICHKTLAIFNFLKKIPPKSSQQYYEKSNFWQFSLFLHDQHIRQRNFTELKSEVCFILKKKYRNFKSMTNIEWNSRPAAFAPCIFSS